MSWLSRTIPLSLLIALVALPGANTGAVAQDTSPPTVSIDPGSGTFFGPNVAVTIEWCDDQELDGGSRYIELNGQDVTSSFSYEVLSPTGQCGGRAKSEGTVSLNVGSNTLYARICDGYQGPLGPQPLGPPGGGGACESSNMGSKTVWYTYDEDPPPVVSTAPHNGDVLSPDLCEACFDLVQTHSTPPYFSLGAPRSVTLFYSSFQAGPRGTVSLDVWNPPENPNPPDKVSLALKKPDGTWQTLTDGATEWYYTYGANGTVRLTVQFEAESWSSGAYGYTAVVRSWWNGGATEETTLPVRVLILNERDSTAGQGWSLAGLQRLINDGDTLIVLLDGAGGIAAFDKVGPDRYAAARAEFSEIHSLGGGSYLRLWPDSTRASFSTKGDGTVKIDEIGDRFGNETSFSYDASGNLIRVTDPLGYVTDLFYSGSALDSIRPFLDPPLRTTTLTIDPTEGTLDQVTDPDGVSQSFVYGPDYKMTASTDREGATVDYGYATNRLATLTLPQVTLHDGSNGRPGISFHPAERRALSWSGAGTFSDPFERPEPDSVYGTVVGPQNDTTRMWFNGLGEAVKIIDPVGRTSQVFFNGDGLPDSAIAPSGQEYDWSWSGPRITKDEIVGLRTFTFTYESTYGLLKQTKRGTTVMSTNYYDALGALDSVRINGFQEVIRHYPDSRGRDTAVVDMMNHRTSLVYDATWGNLHEVIRDGGQQTFRTFDLRGRLEHLITPVSDTTRYEYDALNRVTAVYAPDTAPPTRTHHGPIYADSLVDPTGGVYRFVHNAAGWVTERYGPASAVVGDVYGYDIAGNVRRWTNRNGQAIDYEYDLLGRVTEVRTARDTLRFGYDPVGQDRFEWAENAVSTDTIWYTALGMVDSMKASRGGTDYGVGYNYWHWSGQPTQIYDGYNGRALDFSYNDEAQLESFSVRGLATLVSQRDTDRKVLTWDYPASFDFKIKHTTDHRRAEYLWEHIFGTDTLAIRRLGFDSAGRVTAYEPSTTRYHGYEYDSRSQLVRRDTWDKSGWCTFSLTFGVQCASATLVEADTFTYDLVGNRTDHGAQIDPGNRLTRIAVHGDTIVYDHDAAGNVIRREKRISGEVQDLYWNPLGQLDSVVITGGPSPGTVRFRYDALGRRVRKDVDGSMIDYVWADGHVLFDIKDGTVTEYSYLPGTDRPHAMRRNGFFYYYLTDHLGSVIAVDSQAVIKNAYEYDAWGRTESASVQVENRFRFAGRELDGATGYYYLRARYYDPATGRFLSEDPIGLGGGINPYSYASNDPVNRVDPTGTNDMIVEQCWLFTRWRVTYTDGVKVNREELESWIECYELDGGQGSGGETSAAQGRPASYTPVEKCPLPPGTQEGIVYEVTLGPERWSYYDLNPNFIERAAERLGLSHQPRHLRTGRYDEAFQRGRVIPRLEPDAEMYVHTHATVGPSQADSLVVVRYVKKLTAVGSRDSTFVIFPSGHIYGCENP